VPANGSASQVRSQLVRVDEAVDVAALEVFKVAQRGQPITIGLVRQVLAELASEAAVKPERVFRVASGWVSDIEATRRAALR
jgi:hypothetical protein